MRLIMQWVLLCLVLNNIIAADITCDNSSDDYCGIYCSDCQQSNILCSDASLCNITCSEISSCVDSVIICPSEGDCIVNGINFESLRGSTIHCPTSNRNSCGISCRGDNACIDTIINAQDSSHLMLDCDDNGCINPTIYCPQYSLNANDSSDDLNIIQNCHILGNYNISEWDTNLHIFAVNSWNDINLDEYDGGIDINGTSTMYCGLDYEYSCKISYSWNCINSTSPCYQISFPYSTDYVFNTIASTTDNIKSVGDAKHLSGGEIAGIVIGVIFFSGIVFLCSLWCHNMKRRKDDMEDIKSNNKEEEQYSAIGDSDGDSDDKVNVSVVETNDGIANFHSVPQSESDDADMINQTQKQKDDQEIDELWDK